MNYSAGAIGPLSYSESIRKIAPRSITLTRQSSDLSQDSASPRTNGFQLIQWIRFPIDSTGCADEIKLVQDSLTCKHDSKPNSALGGGTTLENLKSPLMVKDIKVNRWDSESLATGMKFAWNEDIKNLYSDIVSIMIHHTDSHHIILESGDYRYREVTRATLLSMYKENDHFNNNIIMVTPMGDGKYEAEIEAWNKDAPVKVMMNARNMAQMIALATTDKRRMVCCHDSSDEGYMTVYRTLANASWSIQSTFSTYIDGTELPTFFRIGGNMCQVFGHARSWETRALVESYTEPREGSHEVLNKISYYNAAIRKIRLSTGRCYDCQCVYDMLTKLTRGSGFGSKPTITVTLLI